MKQFLFSIFVFFALCLSVNTLQAQVLYQISGNNTNGKSYIFATNALTPISFLDTIPNLFKCYGRCNKVVTEFTILDYEAQSALRQAALLPDTLSLRNYYTEQQYAELDEALQLTLGMGLDKLARIKPQYLTELYRTELLNRFAGYDYNTSSQHFFEAVAQQTGKPVYGLDETGEAMFMLFDREPFPWQCEQLINIINYPEREVRLAKQLHNLYTQGRLLDMAYAVSGPGNLSTLSYSDYQIFARRNKTWVKRLAPYLKEGNAFIVLDAIYLGGEQGLLQLLRSAGYKIKPVNKR